LLHHVDESWFKFETANSDVLLRTSPDIGIARSCEIIHALQGSH
jgi:hypothetical protein